MSKGQTVWDSILSELKNLSSHFIRKWKELTPDEIEEIRLVSEQFNENATLALQAHNRINMSDQAMKVMPDPE